MKEFLTIWVLTYNKEALADLNNKDDNEEELFDRLGITKQKTEIKEIKDYLNPYYTYWKERTIRISIIEEIYNVDLDNFNVPIMEFVLSSGETLYVAGDRNEFVKMYNLSLGDYIPSFIANKLIN